MVVSDKNPKKSFQNSATISRNNMSNIHYFKITSLSFKTRTKIGVCTLAKPQAIFQSFLLEMLGFISSPEPLGSQGELIGWP